MQLKGSKFNELINKKGPYLSCQEKFFHNIYNTPLDKPLEKNEDSFCCDQTTSGFIAFTGKIRLKSQKVIGLHTYIVLKIPTENSI